MVVTGLSVIALILAVLSAAMEPGSRWTLMLKIAVILLCLVPLASRFVGDF